MSNLAQQLLRGSEKIDLMRTELKSLIGMLCGMAESGLETRPPHWTNSPNQERPHYVSFGSFEEDGCVWEVWWQEGFCTRCLISSGRCGDEQEISVAYGSPNRYKEPHKPEKIQLGGGHFRYQPQYKGMGVEGITRAHKHLDVFARGMLSHFKLIPSADVFLEAYKLIT